MMGQVSSYMIPAILCIILIYGAYKKVPVFTTFMQGAKEGLEVSIQILPALVALVTAVGMFRASGALDLLTWAISPVAKLLHLPVEVMPLTLLRPISGSGALVIFQDIITNYGPDSFIGRVASVMQGSTETTFYTIALYYGATSVTKTRHTLGSALTGDVIGFVMSALMVRVLFPF